MPVKIRNQVAADVPAPSRPDHVKLFTENGTFKFKDSLGVVRTAVSVSGDPICLTRQAAAPAAEANKDKLYAKDVIDLEMFARDSAGNETQLTDQGRSTAVGGNAGVFWPSTNQVKLTHTFPGASDYAVVLPEALSPPVGVLSQYVIETRVASCTEGQGLPSVGNNVGGQERAFTIIFREIAGTPDVRLASVYAGSNLYTTFPGTELGLVLPIQPAIVGLSVDAFGILTIQLTAQKGPSAAAVFTATVMGPFTFPALAAAAEPPP